MEETVEEEPADPTPEPAAVEEADPTPEPEPTEDPAPEPTAVPEPQQPAILSEAYLTDQVNLVTVTDGVLMIASLDAEGQVAVGVNGGDAAGNAPGAGDAFRVGSITKTFTALATLTLVDEGLVDLDAPAADYVTRVAVPSDVTVRHLLSHTSGIFNITDEPTFFPSLFDEPDRAWTAEEVLNLIAEQPSLFEPGSEFRYSNSNYLILGVLLEELTGQAYHEAVRDRISDPLDLTSTYLPGFEEGPAVFDPYEHMGQADWDYTSVQTGAWSAGGMISSAEDIHKLFIAVFDGQVISDELLEEATTGDLYGFGLELENWNDGLLGHAGNLPGYATFVRHEPATGITAFAGMTAQTNPIAAISGLFAGFQTTA